LLHHSLAPLSSTNRNYKHWIVLGDFNFDNEINFGNAPGEVENEILKKIMPNAVDTWHYLHRGAPSFGKSFDSGIFLNFLNNFNC
jgi:hypothetical protein